LVAVLTWKRTNTVGIYRNIMLRYTYSAGETITVATGLSIIFSYSVSRPSVANGAVTQGVVSGGTITLTTGNPAGACYLYVSAWGK